MVDISGKNCVIIGGGKVAMRKARVLKAANAEVTVIGKDIVGSFDGCRIIKRNAILSDIDDAFMVIAATDSRECNHKFAKYATEKGIYVNVADSIEESSFIFPAMYRDRDLLVAVSTEGKSPYIAKEVKHRLTDNLEPYYADAIAEIGSKRAAIINSNNKNPKDTYKSILNEARRNYEDRNKEK
jgi:siroheme synthase-like protein